MYLIWIIPDPFPFPIPFCAWREFNKKIFDVCTHIKWNFKPQISPIFSFGYVKQVWITGLLGVKCHFWLVAKVVIRIGCATWNSNLKIYLIQRICWRPDIYHAISSLLSTTFYTITTTAQVLQWQKVAGKYILTI